MTPPRLPRDPLATANLLRRWRSEGLLTAEQEEKAERTLRDGLDWPTWTSRMLLLVATAFLASGVVFFFAYNWEVMAPLHKFALVEAGLALCVAGAWWRGLDRLTGQMCLLGACILVGVFLAVFGQIFQTGADAYQLFSGWAALIFPWVVIGRSGVIWIFWLLLVNLGFGGYYHEMLDRWIAGDDLSLLTALVILDIIALAVREVAARWGVQYLAEGWQRWLLVVGILGSLTVSGCVWICFRGQEGASGSLVWIVALVVGFFFYRFLAKDLFAVSMIVLSVCVGLTTLLGRALIDGLDDYFGVFLLMGLVVLAIFAAAFWYLRHVSRALAREEMGIVS